MRNRIQRNRRVLIAQFFLQYAAADFIQTLVHTFQRIRRILGIGCFLATDTDRQYLRDELQGLAGTGLELWLSVGHRDDDRFSGHAVLVLPPSWLAEVISCLLSTHRPVRGILPRINRRSRQPIGQRRRVLP